MFYVCETKLELEFPHEVGTDLNAVSLLSEVERGGDVVCLGIGLHAGHLEIFERLRNGDLQGHIRRAS